MKFRYKVLLVNLIILSIILGVTGYLLVYRNYRQALDSELRNAASENNMVKASLEYELLDAINSDKDSSKSKINKDVARIAGRVDKGMLLSGSSLYIMMEDKIVYSGDNMEGIIPEKLTKDMSGGRKRYVYRKNGEANYIYVSSPGFINGSNLYIITKKDISNVYVQLKNNLNFLKLISVIVLIMSAVIMYVVSRLLTRPLEKLNRITTQISGGDYSVRADVSSDDEVGELAENFNSMAGSVEEHVVELQDMVKRREQFVADFTHEMKTPMTTIIGYANSVRTLDLTEEERNMSLDYIYSEGRRLEIMSQKLFDLIYLKNNSIFMEYIDTKALGNQIIMHMKPILDRKNLELITDFEECEILGDEDLIKTVFINLLDNARKASSEGERIHFTGRVKTEDDKKYYEFMVKDTGIGMTEEDQKKIFNEFYMADKSRSRHEGGAGLGMSLVAIILEKHEAEIRIESELGKGTTIYTYWKIDEETDSEE